MTTSPENGTYPLDRFPSDRLTLLAEAVANNKNIHIQGNPGWGRGTLVRFLTSQIPLDEFIIIIDKSDREYVYYDDSTQYIKEIPSGLEMGDPAWVILRPRPTAVVVNGDESLKPRGKAYDFYTGTPYTESQIENFHENMLWGMASTGTRVISAGIRSLDEIETKILSTQPNARMSYHLEAVIRKADETVADDFANYSIEVKALG